MGQYLQPWGLSELVTRCLALFPIKTPVVSYKEDELLSVLLSIFG